MDKKTNIVQYVLIGLLLIASFLLGSLFTKVQYLEKNKTSAATATGTQNAAAPQQPAQVAVTMDQIKNVYTQSAIKFGDDKKKLIFLDVSDPSCPYCHIAAGKNGELNTQVGDRFKLVADGGTYVAPVPEMEKLVKEGKAAYAYVYFVGHGNGEMGTKALYCANENGKFWEAHDALMTNAGYNLLNTTVKNDKTKTPELVDFLKDVMSAQTLTACLESGKYDSQLTADIALAKGLGVSGTPGFFVNTNRFAGAYSYKDMESAVETALK